MANLDVLVDQIKQLTGAVNAQIEISKKLEHRISKLENPIIPKVEALATPRTEQDLNDISRLPDCVKELQTFDGNPTQYISWIHNVENILRDYAIIKNKPLYRSILQSIRQKIRGRADAALISYNIFSDDWTSIKKCLSLHYADKRDLRTLEHQLSGILQGNTSIDEFYANINHQFSLIVNKIKTEEYSTDTVEVLIETYRNRALDVFIRGLNGELSRMLMIQRPQTLPEAYTSCLEFQNLNYRNIVIHKKGFNNSVVAPINQLNSYPTYPQRKPFNIPIPQKNMVYNIQHQNNRIAREPPPRPAGLKPPTPMSVDPSIQTRQVNYINRPSNQQDDQANQPSNQLNYPNQKNFQPAFKRDHSDQNIPRKNQRIYHLETQGEEELYNQVMNEMSGVDICDQEEEQEDEDTELNFMMGASLAYHT